MKQNVIKPFLSAATLAVVFCAGPQASSAPIPGTATSTLIAPSSGLFRSPLGFHLSAGSSGWTQTEAPGGNKFITTMYRSPGAKFIGENGMLTVRVDKLAKVMPLDRYIQRWMKEYPKYGFDVLGSKPFAQKKERGYVLDLINRDNGKQLRQVVFLRNQNAVILTCRDKSISFKESLKSCNEIIRTFEWN